MIERCQPKLTSQTGHIAGTQEVCRFDYFCRKLSTTSTFTFPMNFILSSKQQSKPSQAMVFKLERPTEILIPLHIV